MRITIPAELSQIPHVIAYVAAACPLMAPDHWKIELLIEETIANIVKHGYQNRPGSIHIEYTATKDAVALEFRDFAGQFDPTSYTSPASTDGDLAIQKGRGISLIRCMSDSIEYRHDNLMNILTIKKTF